MGDGCRFQPLIFQGVHLMIASYQGDLFMILTSERHNDSKVHPPKELVWKIQWICSFEYRIYAKLLVAGSWTNPFETYARQIGSFLQVGVNIKKYLKPPTSKGMVE